MIVKCMILMQSTSVVLRSDILGKRCERVLHQELSSWCSMLALYHYQVLTTRSQHTLLPQSQTSLARQQCMLAMLSLLCTLSLLQLLSLLICPYQTRYIMAVHRLPDTTVFTE